jgi:hypothetical protein
MSEKKVANIESLSYPYLEPIFHGSQATVTLFQVFGIGNRPLIARVLISVVAAQHRTSSINVKIITVYIFGTVFL